MAAPSELERYEVSFRTRQDGEYPARNWSCFYMAESFAHAEEQALNGAGTKADEITIIQKDYDL